MPQLEALELHDVTDVTGTALKAVAACRTLKALKIGFSNFQDDDLKHLSDCQSLRQLDVSTVKITLKSLQELKKALPNCVMTFNGQLVK